jgi:hypothetical protein
MFLTAAALMAIPGTQAQTLSCKWQAEPAPDHVRSPIQMDLHAAYRIFVFNSDGTIGYRIRGEFPYAAFLSFTIYNDALVYAPLLDHQIQPDPGSSNPFQPKQLVNATNRSYTITVLPDGTATDTSIPNPMFMPPPPRHSNVVTVVLAERIYLPEPDKGRFGGVDAPTIEPFEVSDPRMPAACPSGGFTAGFEANFGQSPLPRNGRIEFYRPPASVVPFADGSLPETKHSCTQYLMATVFPDQLAVIHLPVVPSFFDNTATSAATTFPEPGDVDVRYVSFGSYGASVLPPFDTKNGALAQENLAGPDIKKASDGSATFVAIPITMSPSDTQAVKNKADELGYNVLPLADYGTLFPLSKGPVVYPFLIYRNKVASSGFSGNIQNVPCFQGKSFSHAAPVYAASPENMGSYAPFGIECSLEDFLSESCPGRQFDYSRP